MTAAGIKQFIFKKHLSESVIIILSLILFIVIGLSEGTAFQVKSQEQPQLYPIALDQGTVITHNIPGDVDHLISFTLSFGTMGRTNEGTVLVKLYDNDTLLEQWEKPTNELTDNQPVDFTLSHTLNRTEGHDYRITVEDIYEGDNMVAVWSCGVSEALQLSTVYTTVSMRQKVCVMAVFLLFLAEALCLVFMVRRPEDIEVPAKKDIKVVNYITSLICTILIVISYCSFIEEATDKFKYSSATPAVYLIFFAVLMIVIASLYTANKNNIDMPIPVLFAVLYIIYLLRAPGDVFSGYLWAEDGRVLLMGAIKDGPASLMIVQAGTHWFIQRLIALISYYISVLFNDLTLYPPILGLTSKAIAVGSIAYFMSRRFEWLVKERAIRFLICAIVIFSIPFYDSDVTTCDTSVPFVMLFAVFLIGLDILCNKDARNISIKETVFLSLTAISNAAAPLCAVVALLALTRWILNENKEDRLNKKPLIKEAIKPAVVTIFTVIQMFGILGSDRAVIDIDPFNRLIVCLKHFIFTPYFTSYKEWSLFLIALAGFIALAYTSRIPWKVIVYSSVFSYAYISYASFAAETSKISDILFTEPNVGGRYILASFLISGFILAIEIYYLWKHKFTALRFIGLLLFILMISILTMTYTMPVHGESYGDTYNNNVDVFDRRGEDNLIICIGPWAPFALDIPWSTDRYTPVPEAGELSTVDPVAPNLNNTMLTVTGTASDPRGNTFEHLFIRISDDDYLAPVSYDEYGFEFHVNPVDFNGTTIDFIGLTSDGRLYSWTSTPASITSITNITTQ